MEHATDEAVATDAWPHALSSLRHADQLRAILAGMPRPEGREVDWGERVAFVRSHQESELYDQPALPQATGYEAEHLRVPDAAEVGDEPRPGEAGTAPVDEQPPKPAYEPVSPGAGYEPVSPGAAYEPVPPGAAYEMVTSVPYDAVVRPVAMPLPPQPILWVPTSAFEGGTPATTVVTQVVQAARPTNPVAPQPRDPRFVPIAATPLPVQLSGPGLPTTQWAMRLGLGDPQPVPHSSPPTESIALSNRRRRWRRAIAVITIVVVLGAAAVAGWMVWRHRTTSHHRSGAAVVAVVAAAGTAGASGSPTMSGGEVG